MKNERNIPQLTENIKQANINDIVKEIKKLSFEDQQALQGIINIIVQQNYEFRKSHNLKLNTNPITSPKYNQTPTMTERIYK